MYSTAYITEYCEEKGTILCAVSDKYVAVMT